MNKIKTLTLAALITLSCAGQAEQAQKWVCELAEDRAQRGASDRQLSDIPLQEALIKLDGWDKALQAKRVEFLPEVEITDAHIAEWGKIYRDAFRAPRGKDISDQLRIVREYREKVLLDCLDKQAQ